MRGACLRHRSLGLSLGRLLSAQPWAILPIVFFVFVFWSSYNIHIHTHTHTHVYPSYLSSTRASSQAYLGASCKWKSIAHYMSWEAADSGAWHEGTSP
jgi:hypothetical protein